MEIKIEETETILKIEKMVPKKIKKNRTLFFLLIYLFLWYLFYIFNGVYLTILAFILSIPFGLACYNFAMAKYINEWIEVDSEEIRFYFRNISKIKEKKNITEIKQIYYSSPGTIIFFYPRNNLEFPYARVHFLMKNGEYCGWGMKIGREEAEYVIYLINNFLEKQKMEREKGKLEKEEKWKKLSLEKNM